ncbi:DNA ligase D [Sphingomonas naphthae]|uniref:DNA ligase (ATP) n=1 Tax=Sphingomonas naphthae TaxID=1813468 RepID=A0ABY7TPE0_9SPHN|nr:DNA ligase D [Sphingomonas naphthae]WCT75107.1 DNA ligase D [Sphingomonas naphthae]
MAKAAAPAGDDPLARYNAKRDFSRTKEPAGQRGETPDSHLFMVQKHDATRLHWDFRLELEGVLKSWAVTRGPSLDPDDKRLAVRTEDHPLSYATFEGTIPKGEYGGGTVMLWDRGTWTPLPGKDPIKTLAEGHLHFTLDGERMKGEWIMVRLKPRGREKAENWLLRKVADDFAGGSDDLVGQAITSVETGRTMAEIAGGEEPKVAKRRPAAAKKAAPAKASRGKLPTFREPQLATLVDAVPAGSGWIHEVKYDGYRTLIGVGGGKAKAWTRTGLDWSDRFAGVVEAAAALPGSALIDGEVVAMDANGHPSFQRLQAALKDGGTGALHYFAFDLLEQDGEDLTSLPNTERKARLAALLHDAPEPLHYAEHVTGSGEAMFSGICAEGLEGIISKRADAPYRTGRRSPAWVKVKCTRRQEFVIVGWTPSDKARGFRSLLLGLHEDGRLRYAGKVGTGFNAALMDDLLARMKPLERKTAPVEAPRAAVRGAHWVTPKLVAEVAFAEFTEEGVLRHASFLGLREDKPAGDVTEEKAAPAAKATKRAKAATQAPAGITSPDRVIDPDSGITKGQLAAYYAEVAEPLLAWLSRRPVSLVRCPQGRAKHCFFQKHDSGSFGDHVHHVPIREKDGSTEPYLYVDDAEGMMACVQMGTIEFHGWGSMIEAVEAPDRMVFDLDPDEGLGFEAVKHAAFLLRDELAGLGLKSWPLLSGGKGVHVVVPLDASAEWPAVKDFASRFSRALAAAHPDRFTANMKKVERKGRIFLDWLRNQRGATAVLPYSARARANTPVAAPVTWEELRDVETPARWSVLDGAELVKRAGSKALRGWAVARQALPAA